MEDYPMNQMLQVAALGLAVAVSGAAAVNAGVPLATVGQTSGLPTLAPILKKTTPAVVSIAVKGPAVQETNSFSKKGRETRRNIDVAGPPPERPIRTVGSGVVFDAHQGLIVTNNHVIDRADEITVTLADGRDLRAKHIGNDPDTDVAVIKVQSDNLTAIRFGDSDQLEVGDFVLAIGNPFQIGQTVTSGIVSGLRRTKVGIERYENFIQTDAAIYPGNSGGALIDLRGDLIGISTAFFGASGSNAGMGFAIPINMVRNVVDQILEYGEVRRGNLGVTIDDPTSGLIREMKLATPQTGAVVVVKVEAGSVAARAGLKSGDVVTELAGMPMRGASDLRNRIALLRVGEVATLTVLRDGKPMTIRATMAEREQRGQSN
jgi:Do/DeqQ family serine protease